MGGKSLILILILAAFTSYLAPGDERNLALCLLIDNSGSMDWSGHDPEGLRWEAAKLVIDKTRKGDYICLIDFSDKPFLLQPLTRIDGSPAQKRGIKERSGLILSNRKLTDIDSALKAALDQLKTVPSRITKAVILLTDGEVDVVEGTPQEKKAAAETSKSVILSKTAYRFLAQKIPVYVVALTDEPDMDFLGKLADYTKPPQREKENHFFYSPTSTDLVVIFSDIFNQLRGLSVHTERYKVSGSETKRIHLLDPFADEVEFQFIHDQNLDLEVKLISPDGKRIKPYASEGSYKLFAVRKPLPGTWTALITTPRTTNITQSVAVKEDIKLDMPFAPKFRIGSPLKIILNVKYKGELIDSPRFTLPDGSVLQIEGVWYKVIHPDGRISPEFKLQDRFGDYVGSYDGADIPGRYLVQAEMRGKLNDQEVIIRSEKHVIGFADESLPKVALRRMDNTKYKIGLPVQVEADVLENAGAMHKESLPLTVKGPDGSSRTIYLQRIGRERYRGEFTPERDGTYILLLARDDEMALADPTTLQIEVIGGSGIGGKMTFMLVGFVLVGGGLALYLRRPKLEGIFRRFERVKTSEPEETTQADEEEVMADEEENLGVSTVSVSADESTRQMPSEIEVMENGEVALKLNLIRKTDVISGEPFYHVEVQKGELRFNDRIIAAGESTKAKNGDTLKVGPISVRIVADEDKAVIISDLETAGRLLEEIRDQEVVRWVIRHDQGGHEEAQENV